MSDLVSYIVKQLVNHPDEVSVEESQNPGQINLSLSVNPEDMGMVIGKGGQTIKAIRKILTTRAVLEHVRVNLQLSEPQGENTQQPSDTKE